MIRPVRYIFINKSLHMTGGKLGAQVGHACELALLDEPKDSNLHRLYFRGGHYTKVVLDGTDTSTMQNLVKYLEDRDFPVVTIYDEGHTEVDPMSFTAIATHVLDKENAHVRETFSTFSLYKETPAVIHFKKRVSKRELAKVEEAFKALQ